MAFSFLARESGRIHVCGHRGYSLHYPENTLPAFAAAKACGATTIEIDVVLTAEGEPIVLHDRTLDRTTDGHGFAADFAVEQIRRLDAGARFNPRFAGTRVPTLAEVVDWAGAEEIGIFVEIKEAERPDLAVDRVVETIEARGTADRTIIIGFDHVEARGRAPPGDCDPGHHPCPTRGHSRGVEGVRRWIGVDRARHVPPGRRESAARCRVFHPGQSAAIGGAGGVSAGRVRHRPFGRAMDRRRAHRHGIRR